MRNNPDDLSNQLVQNIKVWLETEITNYHELQAEISNGKNAEDICDQPEIFLGRNECARPRRAAPGM